MLFKWYFYLDFQLLSLSLCSFRVFRFIENERELLIRTEQIFCLIEREGKREREREKNAHTLRRDTHKCPEHESKEVHTRV